MNKQECDELQLALERHASGAHSHSAAKAQYYLRQLVDKPKARFSNCSQEEFASAVRHALVFGKWKELSDIMRGWW